ncbi:membrane-bound lytic murein transglycosylase MltF [Psychromonas sp.]|uniref:membrane-bound lytic murein transglycosylase MltF n=1 Tax=Psychromonas sp. TaxID=1884585 RepID=UPI003569CB06
MPCKSSKHPITWLFVSFAFLLLTACDSFSPATRLEKIQNRGEIRMGTINDTLTYSYDGSVRSGVDYELGKQFADQLQVKLTVNVYPSYEALFRALDNDKVDFLGAGLTLTPKRAQKYRSSPPYYYVSQKVVYHKGTYRPRKVEDINAPVSVLKNSSHQETLENLLEEKHDLDIDVLENEDPETLLRKVAEKEITFAIVDSSTLAHKQRYYPVLTEAFTITEEQPVSWLLKRLQDDTLYAAVIEFMGNRYADQSIAKLEEKYFGHVGRFDFVDTKIFLQRNKSTLPKFEKLFKKHATAEVDWLLLAAVSYQESHWNPKAKSPTGVRGMMMLTQDTADHIGIADRLDPEQSIKGGANYLTQLIKRLPDSIPDDEKIWFALASYNLGFGHLMDARRITSMRKLDPDAWSDVKENLPLLHEKKWYSKTRYGYARGREAQQYVNNIRQYLKTLSWFVAERTKQQEAQRLAQAAKAKRDAELKATLAAQEALQSPQSPQSNAAKMIAEEIAKPLEQ